MVLTDHNKGLLLILSCLNMPYV